MNIIQCSLFNLVNIFIIFLRTRSSEMSARRVLRGNAKILTNNIVNKSMQQLKIRTFQDPDSYEMLSQPSQFLWTRSKKINLKLQLLKLRKMAANQNLAYLSDVQLQAFFNVFVIHKNPLQNKWLDISYRNEVQFNMYVNSNIQKYLGQKIQVQQRCLSFPFMKCLVDRSSKILVNYTKITNLDENQNELKTQQVTEQIEGFKSVIFQHCVDHAQGKHFFTPEVSKGRITFQFNEKLFDKTRFLIRQYNVRVKRALQEQKTKSQQFQKIKTDYYGRIRAQFKKEMAKAEQQRAKFSKIF